jgi:short-subunit dehydrogenase
MSMFIHGPNMSAKYKTIFITGASSGIGRALAQLYASPGVTLLLTGRDANRLEAVARACVARGATIASKAVDILNTQEFTEWIENVDDKYSVDLVVANAGITTGVRFGRPFESREAACDVVETNVIGTINTVSPMLPRMLARARGRIAIVGSLAGSRGLPYSPSYCASKAAIHVYAQALRASLRGTGVQVSLILPGFVSTNLNTNSRFPKPFEMSADNAALIIRKALEQGRPIVIFPRLLQALVLSMSLVPSVLADYVLSTFDIDVCGDGAE